MTWRNERRAVLLARLAHDPRSLVTGSELCEQPLCLFVTPAKWSETLFRKKPSQRKHSEVQYDHMV